MLHKLFILAPILLMTTVLTAQQGNVGISTTTPLAKLHVQGDMVAIDTVNFSVPIDPPVSGAGTRMMWYGDKAAFRVGALDPIFGLNWDRDSTGLFSFSSGRNTKASGDYATAIGRQTFASGENAFASGSNTKALNINSSAMGKSSVASGEFSTAIGFGTRAIGFVATAMGRQSSSVGDYSTATGFETDAEAFASFALGRYNVGGGNFTNWNSTDPLFEIGIGSSATDSANAMTIFKNGGALWGGTFNTLPDLPPVEGAGTRMMWYPDKAAFRAGYLTTGGATYWNKDSIGDYSFAVGNNTIAKGSYSTAFGLATSALGWSSTAIGTSTASIGLNSTAMGWQTTAIGNEVHGYGIMDQGGSLCLSCSGPI